MPKYIAKVNIRQDDKTFAPGDELTVSGDDAESLLKIDAIETVAEAKAAEAPAEKKK